MEYIVFVGLAVSLYGTWFYVRDTLRSKTKPNRVTWALWAVAPLIGTVAAVSDGVTLAVLPVFTAGFVPLLVLAASFYNKNAYWKLTKFDFACAVPSVLALVVWSLTKNPNHAIMFAVLADGLATLPTLVKIWKYPHTETVRKFESSMFCGFTAFFAIEAWEFSAVAFPVYIVLSNLALISAYYLRRNHA
jgi:hypothetical protein